MCLIMEPLNSMVRRFMLNTSSGYDCDVFSKYDGKVGYIEKVDDEWVWKELTEKQSKTHVQHLFLEMKKGIRNGFFELPFGDTK